MDQLYRLCNDFCTTQLHGYNKYFVIMCFWQRLIPRAIQSIRCLIVLDFTHLQGHTRVLSLNGFETPSSWTALQTHVFSVFLQPCSIGPFCGDSISNLVTVRCPGVVLVHPGTPPLTGRGHVNGFGLRMVVWIVGDDGLAIPTRIGGLRIASLLPVIRSGPMF